MNPAQPPASAAASAVAYLDSRGSRPDGRGAACARATRPRPAWFTRGRRSGTRSSRPHSSASALMTPGSRRQKVTGTAQPSYCTYPDPGLPGFPGARSSGHGAEAARLLPSTSAIARLEFQGQSADGGERATPARPPEGKRFPLPQEGTPEGRPSEEGSLLLPLGEPNPLAGTAPEH